jgi:uncharacterized protein YcbX
VTDAGTPEAGDGAVIGSVAALYRYPVKSMQGEQVSSLYIGPGGIAGDRAFALIEVATGRVASAHHPGKWGRLLQCRARWQGDAATGGVVVVTLPDGAEEPVGESLERRLCALLGREVRFIREAPEGGRYEIVHPDVDGAAPESFIRRTLAAAGMRDGRVGHLALGLAAPRGALVDVAPVHVITSSSLSALAAAGGDADLRRFRPNIVIRADGERYAEASLVGARLEVGAAALRVLMPTPRCVITTLAQAGGVSADKAPLALLARDNRLRIGDGKWACLGVYAGVDAAAEVAVGEAVRRHR